MIILNNPRRGWRQLVVAVVRGDLDYRSWDYARSTSVDPGVKSPPPGSENLGHPGERAVNDILSNEKGPLASDRAVGICMNADYAVAGRRASIIVATVIVNSVRTIRPHSETVGMGLAVS